MEAAAALRPFPTLGAPVNAARLEGGLAKGVPTTNYVVPLDKATGMTRPLVEILRDLNKRVPDKIIDPETNTIPWYGGGPTLPRKAINTGLSQTDLAIEVYPLRLQLILMPKGEQAVIRISKKDTVDELYKKNSFKFKVTLLR